MPDRPHIGTSFDDNGQSPKSAGSQAAEWINFGGFVFWPAKRLLKHEGAVVRLGNRALDVLEALLDFPGRTVSKGELSLAVWGREWVEDATLRMAIVALRKALDDQHGQYIENVPGEGYRFSPSIDVAVWPPRDGVRSNLTEIMREKRSASPMRIFGREKDMDAILALMERSRLVSIVGVGGVGKTTTALQIAALHESRGMAVHVADLANLRGPDLIPWQIALILGADTSVRDATSWLSDFSVSEPSLLVLDNCEHVAGVVARIVARLLANTSSIRILTTGREPLRIQEETVFRLIGLPTPHEHRPVGVADISTYSSLALLFERLRAAAPDIVPSDAMVQSAAAICRRLDGLPLSIELAASRGASLGLAAVANAINDRFGLFNRGERTAMERHQSLEATFDWSYHLLAAEQQAIFRTLGIFSGTFSLDMAARLTGLGAAESASLIGDLVDKSLVVAEGRESDRRFRLLESLRWFALDRLREAGEHDAVSRRHAETVLALWHEWTSSTTHSDGPSLDIAPEQLADFMAAMRWATLSAPDAALARDLLLAAFPAAGLFGFSQPVIAPLGHALSLEISPVSRLFMLVALASVIALSDWSDDFQRDLFVEAAQLAEQLGQTEQGLQALWGLAITEITYHKPHGALQTGRRMSALAKAHHREADARMGDLPQAQALHVVGHHGEAAALLIRALADFPSDERPALAGRYHFDGPVAARTLLASTEFSCGRIDTAVRLADEAVRDALALQHAPSLFFALSNAACPIALRRKDWSGADLYLAHLRTACQSAPGWTLWLDGFEAVRRAGEAPTIEGTAQLADFVHRNFLIRSNSYCGWFKLHLIRSMLDQGDFDRARGISTRLLDDLNSSGENWLLSEAFVLQGRCASTRQDVETAFTNAIETARRQGATFQVLEATLAWHETSDADERILPILAEAYAQLDEGKDEASAQAAKDRLSGTRPAAVVQRFEKRSPN